LISARHRVVSLAFVSCDESTIDGMMPHAAGLVRDSQPFCEARFSSQEVKRFVEIVFSSEIAAKTASAAPQQANVFCDAVLSSLIALDARHLLFGWVA